MTTDGKLFREVSETEYEIQLGGRTKTINVPFAKTEALFKVFISNGGMIDPETGQVQTDLVSLISSFKEVGNLLLTEFDENGKVIQEGFCAGLGSTEVIALFSLATEIISNFTRGLMALKPAQETPNPQSENEENPKKTKRG